MPKSDSAYFRESKPCATLHIQSRNSSNLFRTCTQTIPSAQYVLLCHVCLHTTAAFCSQVPEPDTDYFREPMHYFARSHSKLFLYLFHRYTSTERILRHKHRVPWALLHASHSWVCRGLVSLPFSVVHCFQVAVFLLQLHLASSDVNPANVSCFLSLVHLACFLGFSNQLDSTFQLTIAAQHARARYYNRIALHLQPHWRLHMCSVRQLQTTFACSLLGTSMRLCALCTHHILRITVSTVHLASVCACVCILYSQAQDHCYFLECKSGWFPW